MYPIVLGLGGWFLGALVVMTAWPTVPLDDELLALLSVGVPIGLCVYWAWVQTDRSRNTKLAGLTATIAGALLGGWFGFHSTSGLFALLTSILGAVAGANLAVLVFDISWERALRGRLATPPVTNQGALTGAGS